MLTLRKFITCAVHSVFLLCAPPALKRLINRNKTLLSLVAHPDDDTWGWPYLLWRKVAAGWNVISGVATPGDDGNNGLIPGIASIRMEEQFTSCGHLGASVRWLGFSEKNILHVPFEVLVIRIYGLIVEVNATEVITYGELGLTRHPHHILMHHAVTEACRRAGVRVSYVDATPHWDSKIGSILQASGAIDQGVSLMAADHNCAPPRPLTGKALRAIRHAVLAHTSQVAPLDVQLREHGHGGFGALESDWLYAKTTVTSVR